MRRASTHHEVVARETCRTAWSVRVRRISRTASRTRKPTMGGPARLVILVLLSISRTNWSDGATLNPFPLGTIGCLVSDVCDTGDICTNDLLFGTCQSQFSRILNGEIKFTLNTNEIEQLDEEIRSLLKAGFTWKDAFTQCTIQNTLLDFHYNRRFDRYLCEDALGVASPDWSDEVKDEVADVLLKLLKAGEISAEGGPEGGVLAPEETGLDVLNSNKRDEIVKVHKYFDKSKGLFKRDPLFVGGSSYGMLYPNEDLKPGSLYYSRDAYQDGDAVYGPIGEEESFVGDDEGPQPYIDDETMTQIQQDQLLSRYMNDLASAERKEQDTGLESAMGADGSDREQNEQGEPTVDAVLNSLVLSKDDQEALEGLAEGTLHREDLEPGQLPRLRRFFKTFIELLQTQNQEFQTETDEEPSEVNSPLEEETPQVVVPYPEDRDIIQEVLQGNQEESELPSEDYSLPAEQDDLGGPLLDYGDVVDQPDPSMVETYDEMPAAPAQDGLEEEEEVLGDQLSPGDPELVEEVLQQTGELPMDKKMSLDEVADEEDLDDSIEPFDRNTMYMTLSKQVTEDEAEYFVRNITHILDLPKNMIQFRLPFPDNNIMLKVEDDPDGIWTNLAIGKAAEALNDDLQNATGITILKYGPGEPPYMRHQSPRPENKQNNRYVVLTFILVGTIAGVVLAVVTIYLIKRHHRSKQKLANLASNSDGNEASKDYQDLCRQRMQGKSNEKPEPLHAASRIGSVSESQARSPSSRSSTSSWSEEPAASNMDISTGHIVLSYMEDHLRNQDRLDKEWEAVSGYVADPASTKIAADPCNTRKNRFADILPYDHSRVVLSSGANVANSDFINASFITDHDPRNPAYICTQGPLPHTVADFWQMVWEQGSVVIVMLTKLTDNGTSLCHRYWPEEGSDLYHIYEVHLVSEHIWCDDYLVRSFYLKNLQTNETRTVTQFHFLTWPQLSVPASIKALLDFRRKVNKSFRGRSCPIVVHCSDGCGRSGTYCLIDMVLNKMAKGAKEIDMAATLEHIRDQRMSMVTTKEQFQFSLAAVAEEVHAILKALPQ